MTTAPKPRRRWLQFRLKTLLLVTAMLCVPLAWIAVRMNQKRQERAIIAELEELGREILYDWQGKRMGGAWQYYMKPDSDEPTGPIWLRRLLGDAFFSDVVYADLSPRQRIPADYQGAWRNDRSRKDAAPFLKDDDLRLVATLSKLEELNLSNTDIGDIGLAHLQRLTHLRSLALVYTNITDDGLSTIKEMHRLTKLELAGTNISDSGLAHLTSLSALRELDISDTSITDAGLGHLTKLSGLTRLGMDDTEISREGAAELQKSLPRP
jgi:hypothetical protein